jgi:hypothetical protein
VERELLGGIVYTAFAILMHRQKMAEKVVACAGDTDTDKIAVGQAYPPGTYIHTSAPVPPRCRM